MLIVILKYPKKKKMITAYVKNYMKIIFFMTKGNRTHSLLLHSCAMCSNVFWCPVHEK